MEKTQYELCCEVLRRLDREDVLRNVVLIGSWCLLAYRGHFQGVGYEPSIRTRDVDVLVPVPVRFSHDVDVATLLKDLDFVIAFKGDAGISQFVHRDLMLEFIVPERGRSGRGSYAIPQLGVTAQPLRFMDFLCEHTIVGLFEDVSVAVPHPANFALVKVMVSVRRTKTVKRENDQRQAAGIMRAMMDSGQAAFLREVFDEMPDSWQKTVRATLGDLPLNTEIVKVFA